MKKYYFVFSIIIFITCSDADPRYLVNDLDIPVTVELYYSHRLPETNTIPVNGTYEFYADGLGSLIFKTNGVMIYSNISGNIHDLSDMEIVSGGCLDSDRPHFHINESIVTNWSI